MRYRAYRYSRLETDELKGLYCDYHYLGVRFLERQGKDKFRNKILRKCAMSRFVNMHEIHRELLRRGQ